MYVITGATGNIGSKIVSNLLDRGEPVRVIARNPEKLAMFAERGADVRAGLLQDRDFLLDTFRGATAVFAMLPPNYQSTNLRTEQQQIGEAMVAALQTQRVPYVVNLSSVGAQLATGGGIIQPLYDQEQRLNALADTQVMHLRPGYFMENLFIQLGVIRAKGVAASSIQPQRKMGVVATQDIADMATRYLIERQFTGKAVQYVLGPRDLTYAEIATIIGKALGQPELAYVQVSGAEEMRASRELGMSDHIAQLLAEYTQSVNEGRVMQGVTRTPASTTPTTLEAFVPILAAAYAQWG